MTGIQCIPIVMAAGQGTRMGGQIQKQYLVLDKQPVLIRTLDQFDRHGGMDRIILVIPEKDVDVCRTQMIAPRQFTCHVHLVAGGKNRQTSVQNGIDMAMALVRDPYRCLVLIHDGVRPFVPHYLMDQLMQNALETGGCIPVLPVTDTLKQVDIRGQIVKTVDRSQMFRAQTPQVFRLDLISQAMNHAVETGFEGTDDASVMEHAGFKVETIPGDPANIKLTTPHDLLLARHILALQKSGDPS
ncbi:2-C-methyl-D-erythritol 4-phosphate cytidylyltransferase [Desulfotignum phosphitoxidans]|uniref:2-C-methyl-D-erythritol 4-phosphate cytidylyltransferase n=1 Tax=Desulfotignum phosphitoxidans DSM 13687 TaxID=1286635 RepID=S0G4I4_9BACT|nr:2-C-methyl-D-erythritol 4-phosphate cytidylyltransferase [Desulfotignum phosphitoxidans]EMS79252.1 2-C-methyl-D-erythritol 4-phosphate cytidylyltransferase IspD [Desulfotignum phosphitoxidans DSM 13687]